MATPLSILAMTKLLFILLLLFGCETPTESNDNGGDSNTPGTSECFSHQTSCEDDWYIGYGNDIYGFQQCYPSGLPSDCSYYYSHNDEELTEEAPNGVKYYTTTYYYNIYCECD